MLSWRSGSARSTRLRLSRGQWADVREVARAIGTDSRIGPKFRVPGQALVEVVSSDILNLVYLCRHFGLPEVADTGKACG